MKTNKKITFNQLKRLVNEERLDTARELNAGCRIKGDDDELVVVDPYGRNIGRAGSDADARKIADDWASMHELDESIMDKYDLTDVEEGDILQSIWGYSMIIVSYYKVLKRIGKATLLLQPLSNKVVSGDGMSGKAVPDENNPNGASFKVRIGANGGAHGKYKSEYLTKWDGTPASFDHWD